MDNLKGNERDFFCSECFAPTVQTRFFWEAAVLEVSEEYNCSLQTKSSCILWSKTRRTASFCSTTASLSPFIIIITIIMGTSFMAKRRNFGNLKTTPKNNWKYLSGGPTSYNSRESSRRGIRTCNTILKGDMLSASSTWVYPQTLWPKTNFWHLILMIIFRMHKDWATNLYKIVRVHLCSCLALHGVDIKMSLLH